MYQEKEFERNELAQPAFNMQDTLTSHRDLIYVNAFFGTFPAFLDRLVPGQHGFRFLMEALD